MDPLDSFQVVRYFSLKRIDDVSGSAFVALKSNQSGLKKINLRTSRVLHECNTSGRVVGITPDLLHQLESLTYELLFLRVKNIELFVQLLNQGFHPSCARGVVNIRI